MDIGVGYRLCHSVPPQMLPIFGTMGPRPNGSVRLGVELLQSTLGVFRHLNSAVPRDDVQANTRAGPISPHSPNPISPHPTPYRPTMPHHASRPLPPPYLYSSVIYIPSPHLLHGHMTPGGPPMLSSPWCSRNNTLPYCINVPIFTLFLNLSFG